MVIGPGVCGLFGAMGADAQCPMTIASGIELTCSILLVFIEDVNAAEFPPLWGPGESTKYTPINFALATLSMLSPTVSTLVPGFCTTINAERFDFILRLRGKRE